MDTDTVENERFDLPTIEGIDEATKSNVAFRKCDDIKKVSGLPQSRVCDDLAGVSMNKCIGPTAQDCTQSFKSWSKLILASFYGILKANYVMVDFQASNIFFDETTLTIVGIDNRDGKDSNKQKTIADISRVIIELLMKKKITSTDLKPFKTDVWTNLKLVNVEQLYHLINDS